MAQRIVHCEDAIKWLGNSDVLSNCSLVASLPDISEFPSFSLEEWQVWFKATALLIMSRCPPDGVTIFFQSDIKHEGRWIDKGYLCQKAAEEAGHHLLWHKIICRAPAGVATFGKPSYSHLLCFSKEVSASIDKSTADVIPMGDKVWQRGMGLEACLIASRFIAEQTNSNTVVNPFCGQGSMLAAANRMKLEAIGIERSPKRAEKARLVDISHDGKSWINY